MRATTTLALVLLVATTAHAQEKPAVTWKPAGQDHYRSGRKAKIDQVVIHTVEGSQESAVATFQGGKRKVSAHYVVGKDGSIVQCVADEDTAWHAGSANARAIGIEHEGFADRKETWTEPLFLASARLTRWLCKTYSIPIDREHVVGHVEVPGSTHHDPGAFFDWDRYLRLVRGEDDAPVEEDGIGPPPPPKVSKTANKTANRATRDGHAGGEPEAPPGSDAPKDDVPKGHVLPAVRGLIDRLRGAHAATRPKEAQSASATP